MMAGSNGMPPEIPPGLARLQDRVKELENALEEIASSPHCSYENNPGEYGTGVADGHRCAANMARQALEGGG